MELTDSPIRHLVDAGIYIRLENGQIMAGPRQLITPELADYIRANRQALMDALAPRHDPGVIADFPAWESAADAELVVPL